MTGDDRRSIWAGDDRGGMRAGHHRGSMQEWRLPSGRSGGGNFLCLALHPRSHSALTCIPGKNEWVIPKRLEPWNESALERVGHPPRPPSYSPRSSRAARPRTCLSLSYSTSEQSFLCPTLLGQSFSVLHWQLDAHWQLQGRKEKCKCIVKRRDLPARLFTLFDAAPAGVPPRYEEGGEVNVRSDAQ